MTVAEIDAHIVAVVGDLADGDCGVVLARADELLQAWLTVIASQRETLARVARLGRAVVPAGAPMLAWLLQRELVVPDGAGLC
jgi:hypothetical protein